MQVDNEKIIFKNKDGKTCEIYEITKQQEYAIAKRSCYCCSKPIPKGKECCVVKVTDYRTTSMNRSFCAKCAIALQHVMVMLTDRNIRNMKKINKERKKFIKEMKKW